METKPSRIRPEKTAIVNELQDRLSKSQVVILTDNVGMDMGKTNELRKRLRGVGARVQVVPNGLLTRAAREAKIELTSGLAGSTAAVFGPDPVETARTLWGFVRENEKPAIKGVSFGGIARPGSVVKELAQLPTRPILLSMFLGTLNAPMRNLAGALQQKLSSLVYVLQAVREKREAGAG
ncbi:MAG: 50S ribosomal protein L10 [Kiritimatiellia bacterium]|nr:50S ribosomal protein L10 [Kiritimatiellia bacterium]